MKNIKIPITKSFTPPLEEYVSYLKKIWDSKWLTNNGPLAQELEKKLEEYLGVNHVLFVSNGTIAMQLAIQALDLSGEIITTPFTFVATTTSILWEKCTPVFVDINPHDFCIDVSKIEQAITPKTQAILAVHVYGYPCNVVEIEKIAKKHNLKVIYDAAHGFGAKIGDKSLLSFGNISTVSLHATKLFHSGEGGLIITQDKALADKLKLLRSFGQVNEENFEIGINGKNSEIHAALGLTNLPYVSTIIKKRKALVREYQKSLDKDNLFIANEYKGVTYNYPYFPVVFKSEKELLKAKLELATYNITPRRYFYPSLNTLPYVPYIPCPISESISKRVLCLPLYYDLSIASVKKISEIINNTIYKSLPSISIGIPAYNEEGNIIKLLTSIYKQNNEKYYIKEIIINSDGSTDKTIDLVENFAKEHSQIKILNNQTRNGKTFRLNEIYGLHTGDYLLTLDADIILENNTTIEKMVERLEEDKNSVMVAANLYPLKSNTFLGKIMYANNILWNLIRKDINNGDHIANLYGGASMLKKDFSKSFSYPTNITADEEYLYIKAKQENGFRFANNAIVLFKIPDTFREILLQGRRALKEREDLVGFFGEKVHAMHAISFKYKAKGMIKMVFHDPLFLPLAILMNILIRLLPYKDKLNTRGMWQIAKSTKPAI